MEGDQVPVLLTDRHMLHIREHTVPLASPEARSQADLVSNILAHIQEHLNVLMDPAQAQILLLLGQQPMQPMGPPGGPPPPGGAPGAPPDEAGAPLGAAGQELDPT